MLAQKRVVDSGGFSELLFWYIQNNNYGFKKIIVMPGFTFEYPPLEFPPIGSAYERMLEETTSE